MDQVKYTFNIVPVYPVTGDRLVFRIETNIPNFNAANVQWSPGPAAVTDGLKADSMLSTEPACQPISVIGLTRSIITTV